MNPESQASPRLYTTKGLVSYLSISLLFLGICFVVAHYKYKHVLPFWDARAYGSALRAYESGSDPYATAGIQFPFLYPPIFLKLLGPLLPVAPGTFVWLAYLGLSAAAMLFVPYAQAGICGKNTWMTPSLAMLITIAAPHHCSETSLISGNIVVLFYGLAMLALAPGVHRNAWGWFYAVVLMGALLKPPLIGFLMLPLLAGEGQLLHAAIVALLALISQPIQSHFFPALYTEFQRAAFTQVILRNDIGFGVLSLMEHASRVWHPMQGWPVEFFFCLFACLVVLAAFTVRSRRYLPEVQRIWVPFLFVAVVLINPRLLAYDMTFVFVPATYLFLECVPYLRGSRLRPLIYIGIYAVLQASRALEVMGLFVFVAFVSGLIQISRTATGTYVRRAVQP